MSNQLIKTTEQGKENVFPRTRIQDLFDDTSGQKLIDILRSFNMMFVPYLGNKSYTRNQISPELRRQGLWLTYVIDNTVYTEWYDEVAIDDTNWGSDSNWRQGSNALVGDLSISPNGTWVINGEDSGISIKGDKGDSPVIRIYNNRIQVSYDNGITYENLNTTPVYTKFRFNSQTNTYQVSYDLGANWQDISDEKVYHKFRYNEATNTYQESFDFGKTWSNISSENVYYQFRFNKETNTYQVSKDLGKNWTDVNSNKVYYQFRYNPDTNTHQVSTNFGNTWTNVSEDKVFYKFRTNENKLQVSTDLGSSWEDCSEQIAAWFRWTNGDTANSVGKLQISRDEQKTWTDLSPNITNNLYIKGYVATVGQLPTSTAALGDIYMVGPTYDESDTTHDYPHYRMWVKQSSGWVDSGEYTSLSAGITQSLTEEENTVPSNKAISTDIISKININQVSEENRTFPVDVFSVINNPEFFLAFVDKNDNIIFWITQDGKIDWVNGIPTPIQNLIKEIKAENDNQINLINQEITQHTQDITNLDIKTGTLIENPEYNYIVTDKNDNILFAVNKLNQLVCDDIKTVKQYPTYYQSQQKLIGACYFNGWSGKCYYRIEESNNAFLNSELFDENSPYYDPIAKNYTDWTEYVYAKEGVYPPSHVTFYLWYPHLAPVVLPSRKPTLSGGWRVDTVERIEQEIDLASSYGIDYFLFCFYPSEKYFNSDDTVNEELMMGLSLHQALIMFLQAKNRYKMRFAILLECNWYKLSQQQFINVIKFINDKFAVQDNYLHFDGKPFLAIYSPRILKFDVNLVTQYFNFNCYCNMSNFNFNGHFVYHERYIKNGATETLYKDYIKGTIYNQSLIQKKLIPNAGLGADSRPWFQPTFLTFQYTTQPTKDEFKEMLTKAISLTKNQIGDRSILIYAWNEYGEGGWLVPTEGDRLAGQEFYKLEAVKEIKKIWIDTNL